MRKFKEYFLTVNFGDLLKSPIRNKGDIVLLLLNSLEVILSDIPTEDKGIGVFSLNINKMSRIFFHANVDGFFKNFSFSFPFTVSIEEDTIKKVYTTVSKLEIDRTILRVLQKLASEDFFNEKEFNQNIYDEMDTILIAIKSSISEDEIEANYEERIWTIIKELLVFEPGYLRYDFDEDRADPILHPLHHLDVCYSSQATFKLGLHEAIIKKNSLEREDFINVLDTTTACYYISTKLR